MAVISLVGWSAFALGFGFTIVKAVSILVLVLAALGLPFALWYRRPAADESVSPQWTLWAALAIALGAGLSALYSGPWLSATADTFYHLAATHSLIDRGTALPQEVFFSTPVPAPDPTSGTWPLALALVSNLSGQDPVTVWRVMTVALAPVTVLAFFTLALSITRSGSAALIAIALFMVLALSFDFRNAALPNRFGNLLAWLALALVLRFAGNGSRRELVVAAPIAFGASAVHGALGPFLLVASVGGVAAAVLVRSPYWRRLATAAAVVGAAALPVLIANVSTLAAPAPYAAMAVASPFPLLTVHHPWTWVWPGFWYDNPGTVLGTAFAVTLVRLWRTGAAGAGLVIAAVLVIPAAALTPLFATTYPSQYLLARVAGVLEPLAWVSWGWGIGMTIGVLRNRLVVLAVAVLSISALAIGSALYVGPLALYYLPATSLKSFANSRSTDLTLAWRDRLAAIAALPRSTILLAEPRMAYELSGLTGREVVAVPLSHTPPQMQGRDAPRRRADALDAVQGRLDSAGLASVLEYYRVTDVLVDMDRTDAAAWAQLASAAILSPIASGDRWRLYSYGARMLDGYLDLPTHEGPGPELIRSGIGPQRALAGRAVFARLLWNQGVFGSVRLEAVAVSGTKTFSRTVEVGGSLPTETVALPVPLDAPIGQYRLSLVQSGGRSLLLGEFEVGHLYQAEDMSGVVAGDSRGWTILGGSAYEGGLTAIATTQGSAARQAIPPLEAGGYCVGAHVYDYGTDQLNVLEVTLGDAGAQIAWSGSNAGMRWVRTAITLHRTGGQLGIRLIQRGQRASAVDSLEIYRLVGGACSSD